MIRKPPLRTYRSKRAGKSAYNSTQSSLWESCFVRKRVSPNGNKYVPDQVQHDKDIEDISSGYLETTFDKIAKTARLPIQPEYSYNSSVNISSDEGDNRPSPPIKTDTYDLSWKQETPTTKGRTVQQTKADKKANRRNVSYEDTEVVVKKRLKHDLFNISTKKSPAIRNLRRKAVTKTIAKKKHRIAVEKSTLNNSHDLLIAGSIKSREIMSNAKLKKSVFRPRRKKKVEPILSSSNCSSSSEAKGHKTNNKSKTNLVSIGDTRQLSYTATLLEKNSEFRKSKVKGEEPEKKLTVKTSQNTEDVQNALGNVRYSVNSNVSCKMSTKAALSGSPVLQDIQNFLSDSTIKSSEDNRILSRNNSRHISIATCLPNHSENYETNATNMKELVLKPCSIVLARCDKNKDPILHNTEFITTSQFHNIYNSKYKTESSISNISIKIKAGSSVATNTRLSESEGNEALTNQSDAVDDQDMDIKSGIVMFADYKKKIHLNRSLHHPKCSTPVTTCAKMDTSISRLSPIFLRDESDFRKIENFVNTKYENKSLIMNYSHVDKKVANVRKNRIQENTVKRKLSISYEEDRSIDSSDGYYEYKAVEVTPPENIAKPNDRSENFNLKNLKFSTSQTPESLENLKLNLKNASDIYDERSNGKLKVSPNTSESSSVNSNRSVMTSRNGNKYEDKAKFTGKSRDVCSELTPLGIITARKGTQLKLNLTTEMKLFDNSKDTSTSLDTAKVTERQDLSSDYEIIDNSQNEICTKPRKHTKTVKFPTRKIFSKCISTNNTKSADSGDRFSAYAKSYDKMHPFKNPSNTSNLRVSNHAVSEQLVRSNTSNSKNMRSVKNLIIDDDSSHSEWTTLSTSENDATNDAQHRSVHTLHEENESSNQFSKSTNVHLDNGGSSHVLSSASNTSEHFSLTRSDLPLDERMQLMFAKVNTRRRRKALPKPAQNISQSVEELPANRTEFLTSNTESTFDSDLENFRDLEKDTEAENNACSFKELNDSDSLNGCSEDNLPRNLQPSVLIEKLKCPMSVGRNRRQDQGLTLTTLQKTPNESIQLITDNCNASLASSDFKRREDHILAKCNNSNLSLICSDTGNLSYEKDLTSTSENDATNDGQETRMGTLYQENKSGDEFSKLTKVQHLDVDSSSNLSSSTSNISDKLPSNSTNLPFDKTINLMLTKVNIRKYRKSLQKPRGQNTSQVVEELPANRTECSLSNIESTNDSNLENSINLEEEKETEDNVCSFKELEDSALFKGCSENMLPRNLQPLVLIEKLKWPVSVRRNKRQDQGLTLTTLQEKPEESIQLITDNCNDSLASCDFKLKEDRILGKCNNSNLSLSCSDAGTLSCKKDSTSTSETRNKMCTLREENKSGDECLKSTSSDCTLNKDVEILENCNNYVGASTSVLEDDTTSNVRQTEMIERQSVFLKPGKNWIRSLSILNNIQNDSDLEKLSNGKGKNWRQSVLTILNMQQERVVQSCYKKTEDADNDTGTDPYFKRHSCTSVSNGISSTTKQNIRSANASRFILDRSSFVVPANKRISHIEDNTITQAYGITKSKSRNTLSRRSRLKCSDTLPYNVQSDDVGVETNELRQLTSARDIVLQRCNQEDYLPFAEVFPAEHLEHCHKIGEGVYGEVYLYHDGKRKSVIKVIPIEGDAIVNGEQQKKFSEILSEIIIAKELHDLRYGEKYQTHGFVKVKNIKCIIGKYPEKLIELWRAYDDDKGSENDCPVMFDENQLYITLELGHGGQDLEAFVFQSAVESYALFVQTAAALAVAEQSLEFEHRDLHWGNILISHTSKSQVTYTLNNKEYSYPTKGIKVSIIDFTLSRMSYKGCCVFNDLALDPALFTAEGEYQFEIYRLMQAKVGNNWEKFDPYTNILWLHYTLDKMITALRYKRKSSKAHKDSISQLQNLKEIILNYTSAFDFIMNCEKITRL